MSGGSQRGQQRQRGRREIEKERGLVSVSVPADNHMAQNCTFRYDRPKKKKKVFLGFYCKRKVYQVARHLSIRAIDKWGVDGMCVHVCNLCGQKLVKPFLPTQVTAQLNRRHGHEEIGLEDTDTQQLSYIRILIKCILYTMLYPFFH